MNFIEMKDLLKTLKKNYDYDQVHIHHTYKPRHADFNGNNHMRLQEGMKRYHVNQRGWSDIGQHITIFPDGKIVTGREFNRNPASIRGHNKNAFAVEMIGNFDIGHDDLKGPQLKSVAQVINHFLKNNIRVVFHREHSDKTCPGTSIDKESLLKVADEIDYIKDWCLDSWYKSVKANINDGNYPDSVVTEQQLMLFFDKLGLL